jgi:hypothetical protein
MPEGLISVIEPPEIAIGTLKPAVVPYGGTGFVSLP